MCCIANYYSDTTFRVGGTLRDVSSKRQRHVNNLPVCGSSYVCKRSMAAVPFSSCAMVNVVNRHYQEFDVYIGRGSPLGNPFPIDEAKGDTRRVVIAKYKIWLWERIKDGTITLDYLRSLGGKRLGCYCAPKACHGDIIKDAVAWAKRTAIVRNLRDIN